MRLYPETMLKFFSIGVIPPDYENETKRSEEEADGEVSRRRRLRLWRSSKVKAVFPKMNEVSLHRELQILPIRMFK